MLDDSDNELQPAHDGIVLVPVWRRPDGTLTTEAGTTVDLDTEELPDPVVRELAASAIHLTAGEDISAEALTTLGELPEPDCFARSGWLTHCRVLALDDGHRTVDPVVFHVDPEGSVAIIELQTAAASGDDEHHPGPHQ